MSAAIALTLRWYAVNSAAMAIDWSTRVNTRSRKSRSSVTWAESSATSQMRLIEATVSTGYLPLAVSADNITASVPSSTALATSDTSARVGTGLEIIDSIICVAVMVSLFCFRAFDLCDEKGVSAGSAQKLPRHMHVGARLGEGNGEVIHLDFRRNADVLHILGWERGGGEASSQAVDPLVVGEHSSVTDAAVYLVTYDLFDFEHDLAVVEEQHVAGPHVARELLVIQADSAVDSKLAVGIEHEGVPGIQNDLAVLELADPDLRTLQIAHDADGPPGFAAGLAHQFRAPLVVRGGAVREVHAHDVHSREEHPLERLRVIGRRAECGDNLGAPAH